MKLYEIAQEYEAFIAAVEAGEIPEEAVADTLESITSLIEEKADNIACLIKNTMAEAEAIKAEEKALAERRKQKENLVDRLKTYLAETLTGAGYTKFETARNKMSFRKSESVAVENEVAFIEWARKGRDDLLTYKEPVLNKTAIKKALAAGEQIAGARIESKINLQLK